MKNLNHFILPVVVFLTISTVINGGITSEYVRQAQSSVEMPLKTFRTPSGHYVPEQVHLTQVDHDGRAMIISWVTILNLAGSNVVTY
ncbi:unnamed protein product [Arabis nemorensis]|uniref:Purple acid phosphatase N-terminal domain-containing protein n=1 Tax=Arabis nemorensis TaxID=586526 RepID=A0A565BUP6_9BRAS|nr:unnamed protein product [Arabis nemorensis]